MSAIPKMDAAFDYRNQPAIYNPAERARPGMRAVHKTRDAILGDLINQRPDSRLLDFGTGTGLGLEGIARNPKIRAMLGIDVCEESIAWARRRFRKMAPRVQFINDCFLVHEFCEDFDYITMSSSLHHVPDAQKVPVLRKARRVLAPDGRIVIADSLLPDHAPDEVGRREAVRAFYSLERSGMTDEGQGSQPVARWVIATIDQIIRTGFDGPDEYKFTLGQLYDYARSADLAVETMVRAWPTCDAPWAGAGGNYVVVMRRVP